MADAARQHRPFEKEVWEEEALKAGGEVLVGMLKFLRDSHEDFLKMFDEQKKHNELMEKQLFELFQAFPEGDAKAHCKYHNALIRKEEAARKFWELLWTKLAVGGLMGLAGFLFFAAADAIRKWILAGH